MLPADEATTARLQSVGYALITWVDRLLWALFTLGLVEHRHELADLVVGRHERRSART